MLQSIRERAHGWFAWVLFSLISLTFIFWGVHNYTDSSVSDIVATVNGTDIYQSELQAAYERLRSQQQFQLGHDAIPTEAEKQFKQQALQELIIASGLTQAAHSEGLRFTLDQAIANIRLIPTFQIKGQFSIERFKQVLSSLSYTENQFIANLQSAMLVNQMRVGFMNSAYALANEVETIVKLIKQRRDIQYVLIPVKHLAKDISSSDQEIKAYYDQHQKDFQLAEQASIEYVELALNDLKSRVELNKSQLKQFYEANSALFTKDGILQPFDKVKTQVTEAIVQQKAEQLFAEQSERLANLSFSNPTSLSAAASALNLPIRTSGLFTSNGTKSGITANTKVTVAAFSHDVLKQGNNSALIELDPQHVVVLRIKNYVPASTQALDNVKQSIIDKVQLSKAQRLARKVSGDIIKMLAEGKAVNNLFQQYHLTWINKAQIGRYDNSVPSQILAKAFQTAVSNSKQMIIANKLVLATGDYAVVATSKVYQGNDTSNPAELRVFTEQLEHLYGQFDYGLYVDSVFKKAKVDLKSAA